MQAAELYWSGSSIKINFEGKSVYALIKDRTGENYYNVIVDDQEPFVFRPDTIKSFQKLVSGLSKGVHTIELFKRTEWNSGGTEFYGFKVEEYPKVLSKSIPKTRKIEFYGNSITAGYAIEDLSGNDSPDSTFTNNYLSYAAITSRRLSAEYQCICTSGIGITISWYPLIISEVYDRLIPSDSTSKWNFSHYQPDIVVINLFQNDSWLVNMPDHDEYKRRFGNEVPNDDYIINKYQKFITKIRHHYPNANIICSLGCMDAVKEGSIWKSFIQSAVNNVGDEKIFTHFMPYIKSSTHPSISDQETMANSLIQFIQDNINW